MAKALGGAGGDAAAEAAGAASKGGSGMWATVVGARCRDRGRPVLGQFGGRDLASVGGKSSETAGAARIEAVGGGKAESTKGAKLETVGGLYRAEVKEASPFTARDRVAENVAGPVKHHVKGSCTR